MDIGAGGTRSNADRARPQASPGSSRGRLLGLPSPLPQFFATASVPCPYIPGRAERKLIVELAGSGAPGFYDALSRAGFRRSHRFAYRPACRACAACVPVRIAVERFTPTRSIRRVRNANARTCRGGCWRRAPRSSSSGCSSPISTRATATATWRR